MNAKKVYKNNCRKCRMGLISVLDEIDVNETMALSSIIHGRWPIFEFIGFRDYRRKIDFDWMKYKKGFDI